MTCSCPSDRPAIEPSSGPLGGSLSRRAVVAGGLALGATPLVVGWFNGTAAADSDLYDRPDLTTKTIRPIMFPIVPLKGTKVDRLRNYGQNRGDHVHAGEDMMSAKLSLLLACVDGIVIRRVFASSGNYLYLKGDDGYHYGYLHINNDTPGTDDAKNPPAWAFAPGIVEGVRVKRGQQIAWVGDSGNAESAGSHLHFEIRKPNSKWYWAQAISPTPSLDAAAPAKVNGGSDDSAGTTTTTTPSHPIVAPPGPFAPFATAALFATQQSRDFLGRTPTSSWTAKAVTDLTTGGVSPARFIERQVNDPAVTTVVNPVIRLYQAYFGGIPTWAGVNYWVNVVRAGTSLDNASAQLAASSKFKSISSRDDNVTFARRIYVNLYAAQPSAKTLADLKLFLDRGAPRSAVARFLCESSKYRAASAHRTRVLSVYLLMLHRAPTSSRLASGAAADAASSSGLSSLIETIRTGPEYRARA